MSISLTWDSPSSVNADWLIIAVAQTQQTSANIQSLDDSLSGVVAAMVDRKDFTAKPQELATIFQASGVHATNVVLVGVGKPEECKLRCLRHSLLAGIRSCCQAADQSVAIVVDGAVEERLGASVVAEVAADCVATATVGGDLYKAERARHPLTSAALCVDADSEKLNAAIVCGTAIGEASNLVRNLVNRHADDLNPESFADEAAALGTSLGLDVLVLEQEQLEAERMGAMLAVAKGSARGPRLVKLTYRGADDQQPMLALVGKGVTFDTGGYSIKPTAGMLSMKADMGGAATALGTIVAAAKLKLPVNLTAYLGLVENMISGNAYRLGDVLTARNGTTIEVHNTDAEGRLVLADVLAYAVDDGVDSIVDLATLTGACVVGLGEEITGVFPNNQPLADELLAAATAAGEFFWQMPMHDHFAPLLKSDFADCKNVGPRWGGAVTAAKFLEKFVGKTPWVHLDIAGPSWAESSKSWRDVGGTADPVRSLVQWLRCR